MPILTKGKETEKLLCKRKVFLSRLGLIVHIYDQLKGNEKGMKGYLWTKLLRDTKSKSSFTSARRTSKE